MNVKDLLKFLEEFNRDSAAIEKAPAAPSTAQQEMLDDLEKQLDRIGAEDSDLCE